MNLKRAGSCRNVQWAGRVVVSRQEYVRAADAVVDKVRVGFVKVWFVTGRI